MGIINHLGEKKRFSIFLSHHLQFVKVEVLLQVFKQ